MNPQLSQPICCAHLPLAVYREVAAHLQQVIGVRVELLPQRSQEFDYAQSQIGGLQVHYSPESGPEVQQRVEQILSYYGDRYGAWEPAT